MTTSEIRVSKKLHYNVLIIVNSESNIRGAVSGLISSLCMDPVVDVFVATFRVHSSVIVLLKCSSWHGCEESCYVVFRDRHSCTGRLCGIQYMYHSMCADALFCHNNDYYV